MVGFMERVSRAKSYLMVEHPFLGLVASRLELVENENLQSFKSNGIKLEYAPEFLKNATQKELEFVIANGAMHGMMLYEMRKNSRSGWLWQLACDYAINDALVESGFTKPKEANYSKRFCGLYTEEIYAILKDEILFDESEHESDNLDKKESDDEVLNEQLFYEFAKSTLESELKNGENITYMERFFSLKHESKVAWRNELRKALDVYHKDDYSLLKPNKKFLYAGIYLPSVISSRFRFVVAIDSSGSVDEQLLSMFLDELQFITLTMSNFQIELLICDDKIRQHVTLYSGDEIKINIKGSGNTDFRPVFEFVNENFEDTMLLLYFSDLDGIFPKNPPNYEVKWVSSKEREVPFGEIILITD